MARHPLTLTLRKRLVGEPPQLPGGETATASHRSHLPNVARPDRPLVDVHGGQSCAPGGQPGTNFGPCWGDLTPDIETALPAHPADGSQMRAVVMAERANRSCWRGRRARASRRRSPTCSPGRSRPSGRCCSWPKSRPLSVVTAAGSVGLARSHWTCTTQQSMRPSASSEALEAHGRRRRGLDPVGPRTAPSGAAGRYPAVHQANPTGMSLWSAYEATLAYGQGPAAEIPRAHLSNPRAGEAVRAALRELPAAARSAGLRAGHPWSLSAHRVVDGLDVNQLRQLAASLESARSRLDQAPSLVRIVRQTGSPQELPLVGEVGLLVAGGRLPDRAATERAAQPGWDEAVARSSPTSPPSGSATGLSSRTSGPRSSRAPSWPPGTPKRSGSASGGSASVSGGRRWPTGSPLPARRRRGHRRAGGARARPTARRPG